MNYDSFPKMPAACPYCGDIQPLPILPLSVITIFHCDKCKQTILPIMGQAIKFNVISLTNKSEKEKNEIIKIFVKEYLYDMIDFSMRQGQKMFEHIADEMKKMFEGNPLSTKNAEKKVASHSRAISNSDITELRKTLDECKTVEEFLRKLNRG